MSKIRATNSTSLSAIPKYASKPPGHLTNADVLSFIEDYRQWIMSDKKNIAFSDFCSQCGIKNPYSFKDYLMRNFTGMNNTVDFQSLWSEINKIREDKLIKLGLFDKDVNVNFLTSLMKSRFGWHDNTVVVGISVSDIVEAKKKAMQNGTQKKD